MNFLKKIFDHGYKELESFKIKANAIMALEDEMSKLSDDKLKNKTEEFKKRLAKGETLEDVLVEAFAVVREVSQRMIGEKPFYVQILGGLAIHYGTLKLFPDNMNMVEMLYNPFDWNDFINSF